MEGKKKWIVIAVIVLLALFGAMGGKGNYKTPEDKAGASQTEAAGSGELAADTGADEQATGAGAEEQAPGSSQTGSAGTDGQAAEDVSGKIAEAAGSEEDHKSDVTGGISPELVEFLDSYETFMDEYCEFMKSYNESDPVQLLKYASLMEKYYEFSKKAEAWDEEEMTDEETLYYLKVMNRVNEKLLETGVAVG